MRLPDLPAVAESAFPGLDANSWCDVVARLHAALVKGAGEKETAQRLLSQGMEPVLNTPEQFAERIRQICRAGAR